MKLAAIGATPKGGVCRLALTLLDKEGRDLVVRWAQEAGCSVKVDAIGNIFMRRAGRDPSASAVATGSHIDTQPTGGKFDGNYGVLAGLEVIRTLNDHQIETTHPIEVCVWTNEEGSRFVPVMMGSGVYAGAFTLDHALAAKDKDGISVGEALRAIDYAGTSVPQTPKCYFETHIEQGPVLEDANVPIGIVTGALGQRWYDVIITGMEAHAGPTPMRLRKDALVPSAQLIARVNAIAMAEQPNARGTVGFVDVFPNSRNVIPGRVKMSVDFRHADDAGLQRMDTALKVACEELSAQFRVTIDVQQVVYFAPTPFTPSLVASVRESAAALGYVAQEIVSGAGHDAVYVARVAPAAMIFIPCKDGISHNEIEDALPEHITMGANVLLNAMLREAA